MDGFPLSNSPAPVRDLPRLFATADWIAHRDLIGRLFRNDMALKDIQQFMLVHHQLRATQRMYRARFKQWGLRKNFSEEEILAMCRVKAQRDATTCRGSETLFFRRQKPVDWVKVRRYLRDSPGTIDKLRVLIAHDRCRPGCIEKILPHDIYVVSHHPQRVIRGERRSEEVEQTLLALHAHWVAGESEIICGFEHHVKFLPRILPHKVSQTGASARLTSLEIRERLSAASEALTQEIKTGRPWASFSIMIGSMILKEYRGLPELAQHFVSYAVDLCEVYLPPQHPVAISVRTLSSILLGADQLRALVQRCLDLNYNMELSVSHVDHLRKLTVMSHRAQFDDKADSQALDDLIRLRKEAHCSPAQDALILSHAMWRVERTLAKYDDLLAEVRALAYKRCREVLPMETFLFYTKAGNPGSQAMTAL